MRALTPDAITRDADSVAETIALACDERIVFRPLKGEDSALLGRYFLGLSADTRRRFGPHPFTAEQAEMLCAEIDYEKIIRLLAVTDDGQRQVILQGGVQATNSRAIGFYEKHGFRKAGSFSTAVENHDMFLDLA